MPLPEERCPECRIPVPYRARFLDPSGSSHCRRAKLFSCPKMGRRCPGSLSDKDGRVFNLKKLPTGETSKSRVASPRLPRHGSAEVKLGSRQPSPLRVVLPIAVQNEVVNVGGRRRIGFVVTTDVSENQNANNLDRLRRLDPRAQWFDQDYITMMLSRFLDDSTIGTNGVLVDRERGLRANGPGSDGHQRFREVRNQSKSVLPRGFARPWPGANWRSSPRAGTPNYHGSVNFLFFATQFFRRAKYIRGQGKPPEQRQFYEGSLTGPDRREQKEFISLVAGSRIKDNGQAAE